MPPMSHASLTKAVDKALTDLTALAAKDAEPIRTKIARIKADVTKLEEGDFALPALTQAIESLEEAEAATLDSAKVTLGRLIAQRCKEHGLELAPIRVGNGKKTGKRFSKAQKEEAAALIMKGNEINKGLSRGEAATLAGITPEQASTVLKSLVADGQVVTVGRGKATTYKKA